MIKNKKTSEKSIVFISSESEDKNNKPLSNFKDGGHSSDDEKTKPIKKEIKQEKRDSTHDSSSEQVDDERVLREKAIESMKSRKTTAKTEQSNDSSESSE